MQNHQPNVWITTFFVACLSIVLPVFADGNNRGNELTSTDLTQRQAVVTLLDDAANQVEQRQFDRAAASLERALRIDASDAEIWHLLGQVKLYQGHYAQAEAMATKSNALATNNPSLHARNARLLALAQHPDSITDLSITDPMAFAAAPQVSDQIVTDEKTIDTYSSDIYMPDAYAPSQTNPNSVYQGEGRWYQPPYPNAGQQRLTQWREPLLADELLQRILTQLALEFGSREPLLHQLTAFDSPWEYQSDYLTQLVLQIREAQTKRWEKMDKQAHKARKFAEKQERKRRKEWAKQTKKNHKRWKNWAHKAKEKKYRD